MPANPQRVPWHRVVIVPWTKPLARRLLIPNWLATTIGPLVITWRPLDDVELAHELQHVRQWHTHGLQYIRRYFAASEEAVKVGKDRYWDNKFEIEARAARLRVIKRGADEFARGDAIPLADTRKHDVFISHASEDKDAVVRPLAEAMRALGLKVWYDEFELRIGDSLTRKVDRGLADSRFGVVVLSPSFFGKNWPRYELDGLVTRELASGQQVILPIWHGITYADVAGYSLTLADKFALKTDKMTLDAIAGDISSVVRMRAR
jgi:hypothetical protein